MYVKYNIFICEYAYESWASGAVWLMSIEVNGSDSRRLFS